MTPDVEPQAFRRTPTIHDVAAALGMHKSTVSLALSGKGNVAVATRARVARMAQEMGYEPNPLAQRLANGVNNSLVCLCSGGLDVGLTTEKILLIQKELVREGFEVPIYTFFGGAEPSELAQAAQVRNLCRQQPRAIVCTSQLLGPLAFSELERYSAKGGLVVCYDVPVPLSCDQVVFDRDDNAYQAARCLIEAGHRKIGFGLSNRSHLPLPGVLTTQNERMSGWMRALDEAGIEAREEWIFRHSTYERGGAEMAQHFLELRDRPTGVAIVNDYMALAFMVEIGRAGVQVPGEVSLIGHDNQSVAGYCPVPLTSMSQPVEGIAAKVVELLLERLHGSKKPPQTVTVRGELIQRQSVAPPRA